MPTALKSDLSEFYDERFYSDQMDSSYESARIVLAHVWKFLKAGSVADIGCGRGTWLKACHELGSQVLLGYDGSWNDKSKMIDSAIEFNCIDLNQPFSLPKRVDMAISLEVAEHLEPSSAVQFVECLTNASDAVLFSAAITGQGGTNHINERPHSYWANIFLEKGYAPFDVIRPVFWEDDRVCFWYRQNIFLYLKKGSAPYRKLIAEGMPELTNIGFMNCIHPDLHRSKLTCKSHLKDLIPSFSRALKSRIG